MTLGKALPSLRMFFFSDLGSPPKICNLKLWPKKKCALDFEMLENTKVGF
jgi:hypothetical protein